MLNGLCRPLSKEHDSEVILQLETALNDAYLSGWDRSTEFTREIVEAEVYKRFNQAVEFVIPWVSRVAALSESVVVEIGCGTGSSTVAFAHYAKQVHGYDINEMHVAGAKNRAKVFGLENVSCQAFRPEELLGEITNRHQAGVDIVLLYAVLEHCMPDEVLATLQICWSLLKPGGYIVVVETPNRLAYMDRHTAMMPFFHMLPTRIALKYSERSQREDMKAVIEQARMVSEEDAEKAVWRLGTGVSYHDFELALNVPDLRPYVICDGYEREMLIWNPISFDERLLQCFMVYHELPVPLGFARPVLNLILKKPLQGFDNEGLSPLIQEASRAKFLPNIRSFTEESDSDEIRQQFEKMDTNIWKLTSENVGQSVGLHQVELEVIDGGGLRITSSGSDPYLLLPSFEYILPSSIMKIEVESSVSTVFEVFYLTANEREFSPERVLRFNLLKGKNILFVTLPSGILGCFRIDPGEKPGVYLLKKAEIRGNTTV